MPMGRGLMIMDRAEFPGITVTTATNSTFCAHNTFDVSAHISVGGVYPPGTIDFVLWTDNVTSIPIGSGSIDGSGNASATIPADTLTSGTTYYVQALYLGSGSYVPVNTAPGMSGVPILPTTSLATATTITPVSPFCVYNDQTFTVTVTATGVGAAAPTGGTITLWVNGDSGFYELTTTGGTLSGSNVATITVPGGLSWQWYQVGLNTLQARYAGDGSCYSASVSSNISVTTTQNTVSIGAPQMNGSSPVSFCRAAGGSDTWTAAVTSSPNGNVTGNFSLYSDISGTPIVTSAAPVTVATPGILTIAHSGSVILRDLFSDGVNQYVHVVFTPTTTTGCYGPAVSTNSGTFTVADSASQAPSMTGLALSSDDTSFVTSLTVMSNTGGNNPIYMTVSIGRGSDPGVTTGSVSFYAGNIDANPANINSHITDFSFTDTGATTTIGGPSQATPAIPVSYFPNPGSPTNYWIKAVYDGNLCYGPATSNVVELTLTPWTGA